MNEIENRIEEARNRILHPAHPDFNGSFILAAIRDFNSATEDFRRWAVKNPAPVPAEKFRAKSELTIHRIRWTGERKIEFC